MKSKELMKLIERELIATIGRTVATMLGGYLIWKLIINT